jgi:hypothetical protein
MTPKSYPAPPEHLSERSKALWNDIGPQKIHSLGRQVFFQTALEALDRAEEARVIIQAEGLVSVTASTKAVHVHPAAKIERENRALFAKLWADLYLKFDQAIDGRAM